MTMSVGVAMVLRLEVAHGVDRRAVDAHLEVHVRAEAVARAVGVADHLALTDRRAVRGREARLMRVAGGELLVCWMQV